MKNKNLYIIARADLSDGDIKLWYIHADCPATAKGSFVALLKDDFITDWDSMIAMDVDASWTIVKFPKELAK